MNIIPRKTKQTGFTLVEITMAITIIALLVAAITAGAGLKRKVQLNQIIEDTDSVATAVSTFYSTYASLPGDMWNAESTFGVTNVGNRVDESPSDGDGNGDGSGTLENNLTSPARNETLLFWQHLAASGLIEGSFDVTSSKPSVGTKSGPIKNTGYFATTSGTPANVYITLSRYDETAASGGYSALSPKEAYDIDSKYDNGIANSGNITAADATGETANSCVNGANYTLTNTEKTCTLTFKIY